MVSQLVALVKTFEVPENCISLDEGWLIVAEKLSTTVPPLRSCMVKLE